MSTRSLTIVKRNSATKVAQYGHSDGYVSHQGAIVLTFLSRIVKGKKLRAGQALTPLAKFCKRIDEMRWATDQELKEADSNRNATDEFIKNHPEGANILNAIFCEMYIGYNGPVKTKPVQYLLNSEDFAQDSLFCEYIYTIDLDKQTFEIKGTNGSAGHVVLATYSFNSLPTQEQMIAECSAARTAALYN